MPTRLLPSLRSHASALRPASLLRRLPTQCLLCRSWQRDDVCQPCMHLWQAKVRRCPRCAIDLAPAHAGDVCADCEDQSPEFDRAITAVDYALPWSPLFAALKFHGTTSLARPLGRLLAEAAKARQLHADLILPVPLSRLRMQERGYNQSWLIARELGRRLRIPARHDVLVRTQHTLRLMEMNAEERQAQIRDAFDVQSEREAAVFGRDIALVDDVMTTGATLNAASRALLQAGARSVSACVVARTPAPRRDAPSVRTEREATQTKTY